MIIYTDMVGDLFHSGHINLFKQILLKYPNSQIYVGLMADKDASSYKRKPILNIDERYEIISACKYVNQVFKNAPMPVTKEFIKKNNIDKIIRANDMSEEKKKYWYQIPIDLGIYEEIEYTTGISTTNIINRILEQFSQ